ncbi:hypothetical protein ACFLQ5_01760 [Bacteroidota bacterium]
MKRTLILFYVLIIGLSMSFAQKSGKPLRVEIQVDNYSDYHYIAPVSDNGVVLISKSDQYSKKKDFWIFTKYNTDFKKEWSQKFPVDPGHDSLEYYYSKNMLYVFFNDNQLGESYVDIVKVNLTNNNIEDINVSFKPKTRLKFFKVLGDYALIAGNTMPTNLQVCGQLCLTMACLPILLGVSTFKMKPVIVIVDLSSKKKKVIIPELKRHSKVVSADVNDEAEVMNVVINSKRQPSVFGKDESFTIIKEYSDRGELNSTLKLKSSSSKDLIDGKLMQVDENEKIFIGTYSKIVGNKKRSSGMAHGMCFSKIIDNKQDFIKYYDFTDFKNFYKTVIGSHIKKKINRKKSKGKEVAIGYRLLIHDDVIIQNNEYIIVAEAYYPEYHYVYYTDGNGNRQSRQVFDGYRYTHAVIAAFDKDGELLWDNVFEIMNIRYIFNLREKVKVLRDSEDDEVVLVYNYGGYLHSKVIEGAHVIERKKETKIKTKSSKDEVKWSDHDDIDYWYDNYFISWGYQTIKNQGKKKQKRRKVFYFTKIEYN